MRQTLRAFKGQPIFSATVVLVLGLILGRVLSPVFLSSANLSNMLADFTEIAELSKNFNQS